MTEQNIQMLTGVLIFLSVFMVLGVIFYYLVGKLGPWARLHKKFPGGRVALNFSGHSCSFVKFSTGSLSVLYAETWFRTVSNQQGLLVKPSIFLTAGHPPIFIPWDEIEKIQHNQLSRLLFTRLVFKHHPRLKLYLSKKVFEGNPYLPNNLGNSIS